MTKNERGYRVPDSYTTCVLLVGFDKASEKLKIVMSKKGTVNNLGTNDEFTGKWAIPECYVTYGEMANEAALNLVNNEIGLKDSSLFLRHIGVFDHPTRDTRGWYIVNIFYAVVDFNSLGDISEDYTIVCKEDLLLNLESIAYDHKSIVVKVIDNVENDVYTQIFNKTLFESDVISGLLGKQFSAGDLQTLGDYVGLTYDRTTYYRNINKYYEKCGSIKVDGIKKPVTLYQKGEKNEQN